MYVCMYVCKNKYNIYLIMKKKIGIIFFALTILSIPNKIFAEFILDSKSFDYGFYIGSLSESCILYEFGDISAKVLRETYESIFSNVKEEDKEIQKGILEFSRDKEFYCKDFVPFNY